MLVKFFILFVILVTASEKSFCQVDIINTSIETKDSAIIYKGLVNIVGIVGLDKADIQLKSSTLIFQKSKLPNQFYTDIGYGKRGKATLKVFHSGKIIFKKVFTVVTSNEIKAQLGNLTDTVASIKQIILYPVIRVVIPNYKELSGIIIRCHIKFETSKLEEWEKEANLYGNNFQSLENRIKKLQPKDKIIFDDVIAAAGSSMCSRKLASFTITIK